MIGIDQGEIITPVMLLWIIYYDPLLCKLKSLNEPYKVTVPIIKDIQDNNRQIDSFDYTVSAYLDNQL